MATTPRGFPYPADYSAAADVPADMQALAEAVDGSMRVGRVTVTTSAPTATATATVTWPMMSGNISVVCGAAGTSVAFVCWATALTSTGCIVNVARSDGANVSGSVSIHYIAARSQ